MISEPEHVCVCNCGRSIFSTLTFAEHCGLACKITELEGLLQRREQVLMVVD